MPSLAGDPGAPVPTAPAEEGPPLVWPLACEPVVAGLSFCTAVLGTTLPPEAGPDVEPEVCAVAAAALAKSAAAVIAAL